MKTATIEDLETRLPAVLDWLRSGEDVIVKAEPIAPPVEETVDSSKSAAFRDRTGETVLSQTELDALFDHMRGPY